MGPPKSLLDNSPLRELLSHVTNFDAVREHVARGDLRALALCSTSYYTARSVSFFEAATTVSEWSRAQRHGERVPLSLDYLMASLSIPFLFPPTCLHGEFFGDGAMRQTAPLSPAIHLGADRLLVIGVRPTHLDLAPALRRLRFAADAGAIVRLHAGYPVQRPDIRRPREPGAHQPSFGSGGRVDRRAPNTHDDDRAQPRPVRARREATSRRCRFRCVR